VRTLGRRLVLAATQLIACDTASVDALDVDEPLLTHQVFFPLGVERQMIVALPGNPLWTLALNRSGSDFTEHDKLLMRALKPYLAAAVQTTAVVADVTGRCETLQAALNRETSATALTQREIELLGWVEQGMSNADIAVLCGISVRTVHKHLEHVFRKLNVENRAAAVRKWRDLTA